IINIFFFTVFLFNNNNKNVWSAYNQNLNFPYEITFNEPIDYRTIIEPFIRLIMGYTTVSIEPKEFYWFAWDITKKPCRLVSLIEAQQFNIGDGEGNKLYLNHVVTQPKYEHQKIASTLLERVEQYAWTNNFNVIELYAPDDKRLYRKYGYKLKSQTGDQMFKKKS
ncbi:unnamed protein product, partial [Didymodactylos carnosus]